MPSLKLHPSSHCDAVTGIEVDLARAKGGRLRLLYSVSGKIADLHLPDPGPTERADGLWQHTCFEAFLKPEPGAAYLELNFAPSLNWAAYRFDGYREGMAPLEPVDAPLMKAVSNGQTHYAFDVMLALDALKRHDDGIWRLGLTAVIEEKNGNISWWALTHPEGRPDFHSETCFALELPPESS